MISKRGFFAEIGGNCLHQNPFSAAGLEKMTYSNHPPRGRSGLKGLTKYFEIMVGATFGKNLGTTMPEESGNSCFLKNQGFLSSMQFFVSCSIECF